MSGKQAGLRLEIQNLGLIEEVWGPGDENQVDQDLNFYDACNAAISAYDKQSRRQVL